MHQLFNLFLFFIITSLNISVILIHFSETSFSFACFINCLTFSVKYGRSILFGIIDNLFVRLAIVSFSISCSSISIIFRFPLAIRFRFFNSFSFSISVFSSYFILSIFSSFCLSISFIISFGFDIFTCVEKNAKYLFYNNLHIL